MKNNEKHIFSHHKISHENELEMVTKIQSLYKHIWSKNSKAAIQNRIKRFSNPGISLIEFDKKLIGFGIFHLVTLNRKKVMYRAGAVIHPNHRNIGLYTKMIKSGYETHGDMDMLICVRTRSMRVYRAMCHLTNSIPGANIYPSFERNKLKHVLPKDVREVMHYFSQAKSKRKLPIAKKVYPIKKGGKLGTYFRFKNQDALMVVIKARD